LECAHANSSAMLVVARIRRRNNQRECIGIEPAQILAEELQIVTHVAQKGAHKPVDPDLLALIDVWPRVPETMRSILRAFIAAVLQGSHLTPYPWLLDEATCLQLQCAESGATQPQLRELQLRSNVDQGQVCVTASISATEAQRSPRVCA
jgi:hypothetical protein